MNRALYDFTKFTLNFGFLATASTTVQGKNIKCNMMASASSYDYNFMTSTDGTLNSVVVTPKVSTSDLFFETAAAAGSY